MHLNFEVKLLVFTISDFLTSTPVAFNSSHVAVECIQDGLDLSNGSLVREDGGKLGQETCGGGVIDVEQLGGGLDGGGGVVAKAFNGHHIVQAHLLNDQIIKGDKTLTCKGVNH